MRLPPNVTFEMLDPGFWLARALEPDAPLLAPDEIAAFNARVYEILDIPPVLSLPDTLPCGDVAVRMRDYLPSQPRYNAEGQPLESAVFEKTLDKVISALPDPVPVHFGLATRRAVVRAFPTMGVITSRPFEYDLDRIQETAVDVGWPVAVLADDLDQPWQFCLTPLYWGWVLTENLALYPRADAESSGTAEPFIVTAATRGGLVNLTTGQALAAQMGTRLPLIGETSAIYKTLLPLAHESLTVRANARKDDFAVGYLPPTRRTLFTQAFKMLGEPYAWGGSRFGIFGRDCSRFIRDVYATTGIYLPRNGGQQGQVGRPTAVFTPDMDASARKTLLVNSVSPGAILCLPGHVMLYLGHVDGEPYAIHATSSAGFSEVVVSDLSLGADFPSGSLLSRLTQAVEV
jgi:cell wall-associated NlpC family hydrolase